MRLGVGAAVVEGALVAGDVDVGDGRVLEVARAGGRAGRVAVPGFVDLQVNGFAGVDFLAADAAGYRRAGEALAATGVSAYQATLITAPEDELVAALAQAGAVRAASGPGPRLLGVHLEGPFLAPTRLGAHPASARLDPDPALLRRLLGAGPVTCVTLAPELAGALDLVDHLVARGVAVSCGHSEARADQAHQAFDRGARAVTHLFNAMSGLGAREPGLAGAALARPDVVVQVILDGHHLAPETAALAWRAARGRTALVTDAVAAAGPAAPPFRLGGVEVSVQDGAVRRADGTLAGSVLTMDRAFRALSAMGAGLAAASAAASAVPARLLGRADVGTLRVGGRADVVVLDDRLEVVEVLVGGRGR